MASPHPTLSSPKFTYPASPFRARPSSTPIQSYPGLSRGTGDQDPGMASTRDFEPLPPFTRFPASTGTLLLRPAENQIVPRMNSYRTMSNSDLVMAALMTQSPTYLTQVGQAARLRTTSRVVNSSPPSEVTQEEHSSETDRQAGHTKRRRCTEGDDGDDDADYVEKGAKGGVNGTVGNSKDGRKTRSRNKQKRLIRKKPHGIPVPQTLDEASPADKMMWEWKNVGRGWEDIRNEWHRITSVKPGQSSLSVRYIKLNENFVRNGAAGDKELLRFKKEAEEELLSHLWDKVAEKMIAHNPLSEHNPRDLQKRYNLLARSGFNLLKLSGDDEDESQDEEPEQAAEGTSSTVGMQASLEDDANFHQIDQVRSGEIAQKNDAMVPIEGSTNPGSAPQGHLDQTPFETLVDAAYHEDNHQILHRGAATAHHHHREWQAEMQSQEHGGLGAKYQLPASEHTIIASSPSASCMASSPFMKSLVAYDSDSN